MEGALFDPVEYQQQWWRMLDLQEERAAEGRGLGLVEQAELDDAAELLRLHWEVMFENFPAVPVVDEDPLDALPFTPGW